MGKKVTALIILAAVMLCACTGRPPSDVQGAGRTLVNAPFSGNAGWDWDSQRVEEELGLCNNTYDSIYGGAAYAYPLSYLGHEGTIKYMFSEDGRLASVAWTFLTDSPDELQKVFSEAEKIETEKSGEDSSLSEDSGSYSRVWYEDDKDVMIFTVSVGGSYGFQYSYINRDFSKRDIAQSR